MSKHWPPNNVLRPDFRRRLGRRGLGRRPQSNPWVPLALLGGAALVGGAVGVGQSLLTSRGIAEAGAPIEWNAVQAMPTRELGADEQAWEQGGDAPVEQALAHRGVTDPGDGRASAELAANSPEAIRANFGFCHTGGGTNCVVDGDTIWLGGQRIRIADIDTPETHPPRCAQEAELGNRATQRLRQLLNGGAISLQAIDRDTDVYGRKLRVVLVDGRSVGDTLVDEGLARYYGSGRRPWC
jgi:endonuclease YncB( thermonuclease family)